MPKPRPEPTSTSVGRWRWELGEPKRYNGEMITRDNHLIRRALIRCYGTLQGEETSALRRSARASDVGLAITDHEIVNTPLWPTTITCEEDIELIVEQFYPHLFQLTDSSEFVDEVCGAFEELAMNAVQHSIAHPNCHPTEPQATNANNPLGMIEHRSVGSSDLFSVAIADFGIGIPQAMNAHKSWNYTDARATTLALRAGRTGTREIRGIGLTHISHMANAHDGGLLIASSGDLTPGAFGFYGTQGMLQATDGILSNRIQGTFAFATFFAPAE